MKEGFLVERGLYYRVSELGDRPTILLVHGLSGSSSVWKPYELELEKTYNVVSFDLRGHGRSKKPSDFASYAPEAMADDIVGMLDHLGISTCIIVGHSFGTLLALAAIRKAPARFTTAIFLSPTYGASRAWWLPVARVCAAIFRFLSPLLPFDGRPRGHIDYSLLVPAGDWSPRRVLPDVRNTTIRVYVYCMEHIYARETDSWWRDVHIPSLIVHGADDTVIPLKNAETLHALMRGSEWTVVPHGNHVLTINDPELILEEMRGYLAAVLSDGQVQNAGGI